MIERFLLHYFAVSAHAYTRGTFTTPESSDVVDRDIAPVAYSAAGVVIAPTYLKWMLCFEEPETQTLWLAKATPRDWLVAGEAPLVARGLTTRYGRVSISLTVGASGEDGVYVVHGNVSLPMSFAERKPAGGLRVRIRAPLSQAGRLSSVTLGGRAWSGFDAGEETIVIDASALTAGLIEGGLQRIIATFGGAEAVPLRAGR